jgi:signal transduction histidine kinase
VAELEMPTRKRLRMLSLAVFVIVAGIAIAGALVTRDVVNDQERKLLKQRTTEAGTYAGSLFSGAIATPLGGLASAVAAGGSAGEVAAFEKSAGAVTQLFEGVALVSAGDSPKVLASVGAPIESLTPERIDAVRRAVAAQAGAGAFAGTNVLHDSDGKLRIGFVYASPALTDAVIYTESEIHPEQPSPATSADAFEELSVALYASDTVDPDELVTATADLPLTGHTEQTTFPVGSGGEWLLVAKARHSLVGSVATAMPWAILSGGLLAALLASTIVEMLARRREYALSLVKLRTEELQDSLVELKAAHEQLVRQERLAAIGELASTIGHELRNPLGVISNAVYLLRNDFGAHPSEPAQRHLLTAEREISAATVIVSDLLEFARERTPVLNEINVGDLVDEVLTVLPPPTGMRARAEVPPEGVTLRADRDMLRQVLLNLVGNAYQAMADGGEMTLRVSTGDGQVRLAVSDTGSGMNDETRARLFEPFFTTKARGVGLGLAVSKRIVEAHEGRIDVESEDGRGTTFTIAVPAAEPVRIASPRTADESENASEVLS